jgi:hypothetical protein
MKLSKQAFNMMRFVMLMPPFMYFHLVLNIYVIPTNAASVV